MKFQQKYLEIDVARVMKGVTIGVSGRNLLMFVPESNRMDRS